MDMADLCEAADALAMVASIVAIRTCGPDTVKHMLAQLQQETPIYDQLLTEQALAQL